MTATRLNSYSLKTETFESASKTVAANAAVIVDVTVSLNGYTFVGIVGFGGYAQGNRWACGYVQKTGSTGARLVMWNMSGAQLTDKFWVTALFVKS